ncbi:MAG: phosphatidate cytidylyltransferase [Lachnospiraceae bacterium]|nr:phosphatidate cytidylyltransferase [Lachnospiraceae bacterium]
MFWVRLRSSVIIMVVAIALLVAGGPVLFAGALVISLIGMWELYRILGFEKSILGGISYAAACVYYVVLLLGLNGWSLVPLVFFMMALMAVYVVTYPRYRTEQVLLAFFGVFYVAVMISYLYQIRVMENGAFLVWLVFISSWGCDTCAYCVGMLFGKHKMTPVLSPKKSVEGGIGGLAGAGLLGVIFALVFQEHLTVFEHPVWMLGVIGVVGGAISMVGDLTASAIKRNYEIKDYGTLIPGHGGILDRFDSVIITAPLVYYLILLLQQVG